MRVTLYVMPARVPTPYPSSERQLRGLGERLRIARLRRGFAAETVCARANISRPTLSKIEHGDASVTIGNYVQVLRVLGMDEDLATVAADDAVGRRLQDAGLPRRQRARPQKALDTSESQSTKGSTTSTPADPKESSSNNDADSSPH